MIMNEEEGSGCPANKLRIDQTLCLPYRAVIHIRTLYADINKRSTRQALTSLPLIIHMRVCEFLAVFVPRRCPTSETA